MNDRYVYSHHRKDNGELFYIGKGRNGRAMSRDCRSQMWYDVVKDAGGFYVEFFQTDMQDGDALDLEAMLIMHYGRICDGGCLVNTGLGVGPNHPIPSRATRKCTVSGFVKRRVKSRLERLCEETGHSQGEVIEAALNFLLGAASGSPLRVKANRIRKKYGSVQRMRRSKPQ